MSIQHYRYTLERLNKLIYILTIHEGDIKKRLIDALTQWWCPENSFPEDLKELPVVHLEIERKKDCPFD